MKRQRRPRISIGCPVYESDAARLERSLGSVLGQSAEDFELIICDNSPDDRTGALCRRYVECDPRVRYFHNDVNLGAYPSFWRTFAIARAACFKWVADDDALEPEYLARCLEVLESDPAVALCYTRVNVVDSDGVPIDEGELGNITAEQEAPDDRFLAVLNHPWKAHGFYGVYRTAHLRRVHPFSEDCVRLADILLMAEIALYGTVHQVPESLCSYRQQVKDWNDREKLNRSQYAICYPRNPDRGITFPNLKFAAELLEAVRYSELDVERKDRLYRAVPALIERRLGGLWLQEVRRAVSLVLNSRLRHDWGQPVEALDADRQAREIPGVLRFHAAELLRRFEEVLAVWPGCPEPGVHSARAVLLAMLNRMSEAHALLQIERARFPRFAPAQQMLRNLEAMVAAPTSARG